MIKGREKKLPQLLERDETIHELHNYEWVDVMSRVHHTNTEWKALNGENACDESRYT